MAPSTDVVWTHHRGLLVSEIPSRGKHSPETVTVDPPGPTPTQLLSPPPSQSHIRVPTAAGRATLPRQPRLPHNMAATASGRPTVTFVTSPGFKPPPEVLRCHGDDVCICLRAMLRTGTVERWAMLRIDRSALRPPSSFRDSRRSLVRGLWPVGSLALAAKSGRDAQGHVEGRRALPANMAEETALPLMFLLLFLLTRRRADLEHTSLGQRNDARRRLRIRQYFQQRQRKMILVGVGGGWSDAAVGLPGLRWERGDARVTGGGGGWN